MRSSDELEEAGRTTTGTEGRRPSPSENGDPTADPPAGVDPAAAGIVATVPPSEVGISVSSIANLTTALITSAIPLTVLQNGLALNTSMMVPSSMFQNVNPALVEFNGQGAQILSSDLGLRLVANPGFKPPIVIGLPATSLAMPIKRETGDDDLLETDEEEDLIDDQDWNSPGGALHSDDSAIDYSVTAPNSSSAPLGAKCATKKLRTGSRRSCKDAKLTPEEEERRQLRRERNKLAAAKCRQKRVDQTNQLLAETQVLEEEQSRLEEEIKKYQQQKEELEFILEAHRLQCGLGKQAALVPPASSKPASSSFLHLPSESVPVSKTEGSEEPGKDPRPLAVQGPLVVPIMQRPTSFPLLSRPLQPGLSQALGLPISTPSSGIVITLGLDSMLDGHTGLTPVTGFPSIVVQTPQNPTSDIAPPSSEARTPASTALVSL